jgi:hypothetical protein
MKIFLAMRWALVAPEKTFRSQKESSTNLRGGASIDELVWIDIGRPIGTCPSADFGSWNSDKREPRISGIEQTYTSHKPVSELRYSTNFRTKL